MKKILFIEDEAALQEALGEALRQKGFKVFKALDGDTGLRLAKSEKPDLILLDLILPYKEGVQVLQELKGDKETENIPVIVLTNLEGVKDVDRALSAGATTYLVKTQYNIDEIIVRVRKTLGVK